MAAVLASGDVEAVGGDRSLDDLLKSASVNDLRTVLRTLAEDDAKIRKHIYDTLD